MKRSRIILLGFTGVLLAVAFYLISLNFHEIEPGQMYRSAQLNKAELDFLLPMFHIKTIINLRGENRAQWFTDEVEAAKQNGVNLITVDMNSREIPDKDTLLQLIEIFHTAEAPVLIHDLSGADRCGEVSALYEMVAMHKPKSEALGQLSMLYHHFEFSRPAKKYFINLYQGEDWAKNEYDPCSGRYKYYDTNNVKCHPENKKACATAAGGVLSETPQCQ
jgi:protein tyrosine/serine phosphatase